jgi:DNA-3-methyladenine glycosylase
LSESILRAVSQRFAVSAKPLGIGIDDRVNEPLPRSFYDRPVEDVARDLLGMRLCRKSDRGTTIGRIVEVEAYLASDDPASHSFRGRSRKNQSMFGPPGLAYVYSIHARYCMNVVTEPAGVASAVLLRAVQPLHGLELMQQRRHTSKLLDLARGPARLCEAFAIDRSLDGSDLTDGENVWICADEAEPLTPAQTVVTGRIGVSAAHDLPLRFVIAGSPFASGPRRLAAADPQQRR